MAHFKVRVLHYPCVVHAAPALAHKAHGPGVTGVAFLASKSATASAATAIAASAPAAASRSAGSGEPALLVSVGGKDRCVLVWRYNPGENYRSGSRGKSGGNELARRNEQSN
jgi:hypothetical protein